MALEPAVSCSESRRRRGLTEEVMHAFKRARCATSGAEAPSLLLPLYRKRSLCLEEVEERDALPCSRMRLTEEVSLGVAQVLDELVGVDVHQEVIEARLEACVDELERRIIPELQKIEANGDEGSLRAEAMRQQIDSLEQRISEMDAELHFAQQEKREALLRAFRFEEAYAMAMQAWGRDVQDFNSRRSTATSSSTAWRIGVSHV